MTATSSHSTSTPDQRAAAMATQRATMHATAVSEADRLDPDQDGDTDDAR